MEYCSPYSKINSDNNISCYSKSILKKIAIQYNKYNKDKIIIPKNLDNDEQLKTVWDQILNKINKKYKYICKEEYCWKNLNFLNKKIKKKLIKNIRPEQPISWKKNNFEWLSTTDLNNALNPYKQLHQAYLYIGAITLDYDYELIPGICISDELCKLNLKKLYFNKGIRYIGVVFNLDKHNQSGSHWVSFLANLNNGGIYYFDSIGIMPKNEVQKLMETIRIQGNNLIKDQLIDFSESFLSVRFITKMNYDDLGNTFISNNCGKPISAQDQLTFLDTDVSNYIVQQTCDNWKAVGETFSSVNKINNSRRKLDKEVRCTAMLYSSNPSHNFNWSFSEAKDFYENGKISDFASALNTWFSCLKFLSGNGRGKTAKGLRLLVYIFQGNYSQSDKFNLKDTKTLVSEFIKWEQSRYDSREIIEYFKSGNTKLATYKELCTSHSDAEICKRTNIIEEEFVIPNLQKWLANSVISKRLSRQVFTT